jgi:hypothetical protein
MFASVIRSWLSERGMKEAQKELQNNEKKLQDLKKQKNEEVSRLQAHVERLQFQGDMKYVLNPEEILVKKKLNVF